MESSVALLADLLDFFNFYARIESTIIIIIKSEKLKSFEVIG